VLLGLRRGRLYAIGWGSVALASGAGAAGSEPKLTPLAVAYAVGLACHLRCRPDDVASVTTNEMGIIFFGIAGALISAALLAPALARAGAASTRSDGAPWRWRRRPAPPWQSRS
jgi:hypothetical protein